MEKTVKSRDGNIIDDVITHADEALENARTKGNEYWDLAKDKGESLLGDAQSSTRKTWNRTKGFIQKHPYQAAGYAVLLGAALAILFYPKSQD